MNDKQPDEDTVRSSLDQFLRGDSFSCIGGRIAAMRDAVQHHHYARLGDEADSRHIYRHLRGFAKNRDGISNLYATFIATFAEPQDVDELEFERLLWRQLQLLHDIDREFFEWAPGVPRDPRADKFALSLVGEPFFVVGMHRNASRMARRFEWAALVFNSHIQFQRLRENGLMPRIRKVVRRRELELQGSLNPRLIDFGYRPEAIRYSGRAVEDSWVCPFRAGPEDRRTCS